MMIKASRGAGLLGSDSCSLGPRGCCSGPGGLNCSYCTQPLLQVKTLTGKEIEIDIEPTDTITRIKERVEEREGIPPVSTLVLGICSRI